MKSYLTLLFLLIIMVCTSQAQITKKLLTSIPKLELNKDYTYKSLKANSDKLDKIVSLADKKGKTHNYQVIGKINIGKDWYLLTFTQYYKRTDDYVSEPVFRKYNPKKLEEYDKDPEWIDISLFVHSAEFTEVLHTIRFEKEYFIVRNETGSIKLTWKGKLRDFNGIGKEELLINVDKFPDLPLDEDIDIKKVVEIINNTKVETFCNIDGYCHFNVVGKVQGKNQLHIFLGFNYNFEDKYKDELRYEIISIKGKNLKGWISPDNWYPSYEYDIDSFKVTADKKYVIIKKEGKEIKKELR